MAPPIYCLSVARRAPPVVVLLRRQLSTHPLSPEMHWNARLNAAGKQAMRLAIETLVLCACHGGPRRATGKRCTILVPASYKNMTLGEPQPAASDSCPTPKTKCSCFSADGSKNRSARYVPLGPWGGEKSDTAGGAKKLCLR
jgi:hypothetical protein